MQDGVKAGIYVYFGTANAGKKGDIVTVSGSVKNQFEWLELISPSVNSIDSTGNTLPEYIEIDAANILSSEAYESMMVKFINGPFTVVSTDSFRNTKMKDRNNKEFTIRSTIYTYPAPVDAATYIKLQGVLNFGYGEYKLSPVTADDIQ